ncbi:hypothetical protein AA0117_g10921 [Alternaria alternata]|uniref:Extracellular membrane protein CFEM domain-containing protein n=1 Tax=Alternaria alternata TaxID=5599 RepID=A0A4Q4N307_ALTAL|nr:hypothetical protein AA0117_g10921 [Alternaria alternata]
MVLPTFSTLLPTLAVLLHILTTAIAQDTFCKIYFGASYADYCCIELHSHGPPCDTPISVANATDCTEEVYLRGWFCCIDVESSDPNGPVWSCGQSWETDEDGTTSVVMGSGLSMHSSVWKE